MEDALWFKILALFGLVAMIAAITTYPPKPKANVKLLLDSRLVLLDNLVLYAWVGIYAYTLITLDSILITDLISPAVWLAGILIIVKAKLDLGKHHTGAGFHRENTELVTTGIYSFIRHPIYLGLSICFIGSSLVLIPHAPWYLSVVWVLLAVYGVTFLVLSARRESTMLASEFNEEFSEYRQQVHPILPLRHYHKH